MFTSIVIPSKKYNSWNVNVLVPGIEPKSPAIGRIFAQSILPKSEKAEEMLRCFPSFRLMNKPIEEDDASTGVTIPILAYILTLPNQNGYPTDYIYDTFMDYGLSACIKEDLIIPKFRLAHYGELPKVQDKIWPLLEKI